MTRVSAEAARGALAQRLQTLEANYRRHAELAETTRVARNAAVREALAQGWTHAEVAEVTGLTRGRVNQIAQQS